MNKGIGEKRVLVTGGAGFIGANLVRVLLRSGCQVSVLDNLSIGQLAYLEGLPIEVVKGDILDVDVVQKAVNGHSTIIHLAFQRHSADSSADAWEDCEANIRGTLNLLEASRRHAEAHNQHPTFVYASSNWVLGRSAPPSVEDKIPFPDSPFGASKIASEAYCSAYYLSSGVRTVTLRFGNVYGPFSAHKDSIVTRLVKASLRSSTPNVARIENKTRDFIYVEDVCYAIFRAIQSDARGQIFQLATGVETSTAGVSLILQNIAMRETNPHYRSPSTVEVTRGFSPTKSREQLGWEPTIGLNEGLHRTWQWFKNWERQC